MTDDAGDGYGGRNGAGSGAPARPVRESRGKARRSRQARNGFVIFLNLIFSVAVGAVIAGAGLLYWGKQEFEESGPLTAEATFMVPRGGGLETIATGLERNGIISDARVFQAGVWMADAAADLKAGEYGFAPGASMREVMEKIRGGSSILHSITIPEGWTVAQIYERLRTDETLVGDMPPMAPEGTLLPETYRFTRGMSRSEIVAQMTAAQTELVNEIWEGREPDLPVEDIGQFVTLASIVEKETGVADERPRVASVFINRLREGMRLQSDPTIIYGIWGGAGKPADEPIRQSHIASQTPYNTYVIRGLPPGPIANPGRAALEAVATPSDSQDLYFVADGSGGHAFSRTLDEHNRNVQRYREIERSQAAEQAGAADATPE